MPTLLLPEHGVAEVARRVIEELIDCAETCADDLAQATRGLLEKATALALDWLAALRLRTRDQELGRDAEHRYWLRNPDFAELRRRDAAGVLISRQWPVAVDVLRQRAVPVLAGQGLANEDAEDVLMQALGDLLQARREPGPMEGMRVFEELPRLFAMVVDRAGISWLRKRSARKRLTSNPALAVSLDDPDQRLAERLPDAASTSLAAALEQAPFHRMKAVCGAALSPFEWHIIEALFVECSSTRLELASDAWVLEQLEIEGSASESKRRRALNAVVEGALARLGAALREADL
jgi:hypothetical protein